MAEPFTYQCPKCGSGWCRLGELRASSGGITAYFNLDTNVFTAVSCKNCDYTEFYYCTLGTFKERYGLTENEFES